MNVHFIRAGWLFYPVAYDYTVGPGQIPAGDLMQRGWATHLTLKMYLYWSKSRFVWFYIIVIISMYDDGQKLSRWWPEVIEVSRNSGSFYPADGSTNNYIDLYRACTETSEARGTSWRQKQSPPTTQVDHSELSVLNWIFCNIHVAN